MAKLAGFVGPAYRSQNPIAAADTCINRYPEKIESGTGKSTYQLLPCPGLTQFCDLGTSSPIRGQFTLNGATFVVAGGTLYQAPFTLGGSATTLATGITNPDDSLVSMAGNGDGGFQLVIASAGLLYCYDIRARTLTPITGATVTSNIGAPGPLEFRLVASGSQAAGFYGYVQTSVTAAGETTASTVFVHEATVADPGVVLYAPAGQAGVVSRNIYRTTVQVTAAAAQTATLKFLTTVTNGTTLLTDSAADAALGVTSPPTTNTANTTTATDSASIGASFVTFVDGAFYALDPSTSNLYVSAPEDGSTWDPADVIQRTDNPDKWNALLLSHGELWLLGSQTGSVYYDAGASDFPFLPNPSGKVQYGILAPHTAQLLDGDAMWLAQNALGGLIVVKAQGYIPQRVSTHAMEYAWSQYTTVSDADAFTYQEQGHSFYALNFPTANATWVYDATTGLWHQRGLWDGNTFGVMDVRTHTYAQGVHLVGSRSTGVIWQMTSDVFTDTDGNGMVRQRRAPHVCDELKRIIYDRFQLDMEIGVGLATGQGSAPLVMLRWSDDGGQSWSNVHTASVGRVGEFKTRVIWRKLGIARDRVFEVTDSDPIPSRYIDAYLEYRVGAS